MHTCDRDGQLMGAIESAAWRMESGLYCIQLGDGGYLALSEDDVAAINAIQDRGQKEAEEGISAAHEAWERRRFLNVTSRELFRDLYSRCTDLKQSDVDRVKWTAEVAKIASEAAGELLYEVERIAADLKKNTGMEVA